MSPELIVERERRWARPVAACALGGAVLYAAALIVEQAAGLTDRTNDASLLSSYHEHSGPLLATSAMLATGVLLLSVPLAYLFMAAKARNENVRTALIGFCFIGPALLAAQVLLNWAALTEVGDDYVSRGVDSDVLAGVLIDHSTFLSSTSGLSFPAVLGLLVAMVYTPLQAMRVGLLPRFWGTLGMALGASLALFPPVALMGLLMWFTFLGLVVAGRWPGGQPPAWEAGVAIPWPKPGEEEEEAEKPAGGTVDGHGEELTDPSDSVELAERQGRQASQRRKRKRRG